MDDEAIFSCFPLVFPHQREMNRQVKMRMHSYETPA